MGLDMYAFRVKAEDVIDDFTVRNEEQGREGDLEELAYWRKHHDLHGWMERLYRAKGGDKERIFSEHLACHDCSLSFEELEPRSFSFNSKRSRSTLICDPSLFSSSQIKLTGSS
jgi:excinuclease UvrABC ATPase subunit